MKMIENLSHLLAQKEIAKLIAELDSNVAALFSLGLSHYDFGSNLANIHWRQKLSRLYYGVYNIRRAVVLKTAVVFQQTLQITRASISCLKKV
jgi:hypothetical protein